VTLVELPPPLLPLLPTPVASAVSDETPNSGLLMEQPASVRTTPSEAQR
jgi:hypothetical protein